MFDWDPAKARSNFAKHGVTFQQALSVFGDPMAVAFPDLEHSDDEDRFVTFGYSLDGLLLAVVHVENGPMTRIISARIATRRERLLYEEG